MIHAANHLPNITQQAQKAVNKPLIKVPDPASIKICPFAAIAAEDSYAEEYHTDKRRANSYAKTKQKNKNKITKTDDIESVTDESIRYEFDEEIEKSNTLTEALILAKGIGELFKSKLEVIIHDLTQTHYPIKVGYNLEISERKIGDTTKFFKPLEYYINSFRSYDFYYKDTPLKASTIILKNKKGHPVMGISFNFKNESPLNTFRQFLNLFFNESFNIKTPILTKLKTLRKELVKASKTTQNLDILSNLEKISIEIKEKLQSQSRS